MPARRPSRQRDEDNREVLRHADIGTTPAGVPAQDPVSEAEATVPIPRDA
ncbi:MAG: hypothetical protein HY666_03855 [Chloroflexi bacterium]|nr:hypothetical protein [Chloroflexota bacterium]